MILLTLIEDIGLILTQCLFLLLINWFKQDMKYSYIAGLSRFQIDRILKPTALRFKIFLGFYCLYVVVNFWLVSNLDNII